MKILMVTNQVKTYALGFKNVIEPLQQLGHQVLWAANFSDFIGSISSIPCDIIQIPISSNPFNLANIQAYRELLSTIRSKGVEGVYCSTPIGGTLGRLAAKVGGVSPVVYAAHGFLFFKGVPMIKRLLFWMHEALLAHWTDTLITITTEDYLAAKKMQLRTKGLPNYIHGAGVEVNKSVKVDRKSKRTELGVPLDSFVLVSAGSLNKNKNNRVVIRSLTRLTSEVHYLVCGEGKEAKELEALTRKCKCNQRVKFLGFREDIAEIMSISDAFILPSRREGIPRALLEAMDLGLPCIASRIRGITDLISDGKGGFLCKPNSISEITRAVNMLKNDPLLRRSMGEYNKRTVYDYSDSVVRSELYCLFKAVFNAGHDK